jgi:hypothetical protein
MPKMTFVCMCVSLCVHTCVRVRVRLCVPPTNPTGPGIQPGLKFDYVGSNVDLAPTFLGLAGVDSLAQQMDGRSVVPLLVNASDANVPLVCSLSVLRVCCVGPCLSINACVGGAWARTQFIMCAASWLRGHVERLPV